jgi:multiple sugar transport system ATP-binding protein
VSTDGDGLPITVEVVEELGADAYVYGTPQCRQIGHRR